MLTSLATQKRMLGDLRTACLNSRRHEAPSTNSMHSHIQCYQFNSIQLPYGPSLMHFGKLPLLFQVEDFHSSAMLNETHGKLDYMVPTRKTNAGISCLLHANEATGIWLVKIHKTGTETIKSMLIDAALLKRCKELHVVLFRICVHNLSAPKNRQSITFSLKYIGFHFWMFGQINCPKYVM